MTPADPDPIKPEDLTAEGFGVNADTEAEPPVAGAGSTEEPGEGFGISPEAVENAGIADDDVPASTESPAETAPTATPDDDSGTETSDAPGVGFDAPAPQGDGVTDTPPTEDRPI